MSIDVDALALWLFGGASGQPVPRANGDVPSLDVGILQRLVQVFQGQPMGGTQHLTAISTATALTVPDMALSALVTVTGADVYATFDSSTPSVTNGNRFPQGTVLRLTGRDTMKGVLFLQQSAATVLDVTYWT